MAGVDESKENTRGEGCWGARRPPGGEMMHVGMQRSERWWLDGFCGFVEESTRTEISTVDLRRPYQARRGGMCVISDLMGPPTPPRVPFFQPAQPSGRPPNSDLDVPMPTLVPLVASAAACVAVAYALRGLGRTASPTLLVRPTFVLFGDSITQQGHSPGGWVSRLADAYSRKVDVINRGYSGYNSRWALHALKTVFAPGIPSPPVLATVFFGANDAALPDYPGQRQHVPVPEYAENLKKIVRHIRSVAGEGVAIVLITPPPIDEPGRLAYLQKNPPFNQPPPKRNERTLEFSNQYARKCVVVGREVGAAVLDVWTAIARDDSWQRHLSDGLHLSESGNALVYRELQALVLREFPHLDPEKMSPDLPWHFQIDPLRPSRAFQS